MFHHRSSFRVLTALAAASMLAACQGGAASPPAAPVQGAATQSAAQSVQSAARSTASHHAPSTPAPELAANPASLEFSADQAAAGTPQTVTVTSKSDRKLHVAIAATGNCPQVSPALLKARPVDEDGDKDHDRKDAAAGVITVTPNGAGPATCTITVTSSEGDGDKDHHDGDHHDDHHDGDHHDNDGDHHDAGDAIAIPVTVDAPATPVPTATPTQCPALRGC